MQALLAQGLAPPALVRRACRRAAACAPRAPRAPLLRAARGTAAGALPQLRPRRGGALAAAFSLAAAEPAAPPEPLSAAAADDIDAETLVLLEWPALCAQARASLLCAHTRVSRSEALAVVAGR